MKEINEIRDDLIELKPTFLAGVPRVFERIHEGKRNEGIFTFELPLLGVYASTSAMVLNSSLSLSLSRSLESTRRSQLEEEANFPLALQIVMPLL